MEATSTLLKNHHPNTSMNALAKPPTGLPSLQHKSRSGPKSSSRGVSGPRLARTWTLRSSTATAALPLPFMEISVSVLDTIDLVRSSVEEEVVFQATMQVPAHHAIMCRIEAYDTPFAAAPTLADAPQLEHMSEQDRQFAACLASPVELEEAHSFSFANRTQNVSFLQRSAPSVRFASGVLSVSLSLKQRSRDMSGSTQQEDGGEEDEVDLDRAIDSFIRSTGNTATPHTLPAASGGSSFRASSSHAAAAISSSSGSAGSTQPLLGADSSSSCGSQPVAHRPSLQLPRACASIPEDPAAALDVDTPAAAAPAAGATAAVAASSGGAAAASSQVPPASRQARRSLEQQDMPQRPAGLLRVQSITAQGRKSQEIPLTTRLANKGVSTLLGVGYMMLQALEARTDPATKILQYQVEGFTHKPSTTTTTTATKAWPQTAGVK